MQYTFSSISHCCGRYEGCLGISSFRLISGFPLLRDAQDELTLVPGSRGSSLLRRLWGSMPSGPSSKYTAATLQGGSHVSGVKSFTVRELRLLRLRVPCPGKVHHSRGHDKVVNSRCGLLSELFIHRLGVPFCRVSL